MLDLLIVLGLIVVNGVFALSELAIVSARQTRLKAMAEAKRFGAARALALASNPGRFLSAVQIGITLVGVINGAYSAETYGELLTAELMSHGVSEAIAEPLGYGAVIALITYLSVILGELVPKHLALRNTEDIACAVAPFMTFFAKLAAPGVWFLDSSTRLVFRLLPQPAAPASRVTDEEIRALIAEAETAGVVDSAEREMIGGVMRLADRTIAELMTPRTEVEWIDLTSPEAEVRSQVLTAAHSRLPVADGSVDAMIGVVLTRELLVALVHPEPLELRAKMKPPLLVPDSVGALDALERLRSAEVPMALVVDEFGHFEGVVTPADLLDAITGGFPSETGADPHAVQREDGSWLLSGAMPAREMGELLDIPVPEDRPFTTVAGFVLAKFHRLPEVGERIDTDGWRFEIVDLDARRIDKVLATRDSGRRTRA